MSAYRFIRFAARGGDAGRDEIRCGDQRAFLLAPQGEVPRMLDGLCPHRGGPLALGHFDCRSRSLQCPWHGQRHRIAKLQADALPAIRIGSNWMVALAHEEGDVEPVHHPHAAPA